MRTWKAHSIFVSSTKPHLLFRLAPREYLRGPTRPVLITYDGASGKRRRTERERRKTVQKLRPVLSTTDLFTYFNFKISISRIGIFDSSYTYSVIKYYLVIKMFVLIIIYQDVFRYYSHYKKVR